MAFKRRRQGTPSKTQKGRDIGKFSLWYTDRDYPSRTCVATGKISVILDNGEEVQLRIYLHENHNKKGAKSPDFFGFVKEDEGSLTPLSLTTKHAKVVEIAEEEYIQESIDDDDMPFE